MTCFTHLTHLSRLTRLPALPRLPGPRLSSALLGATALELFVLTGRLIVYPFGLTPERGGTGPAEAGPPATTDPTATTVTTAPPVTAAATPPVVLLHGFIDNRSAFLVLRRALTRHGRRLASLNYSPLTRDVRTAAELLGRHVEEICARTGHDRVDIVGHSLGGLIARYYVQRLGGDRRVRTLVTLGTPHGGTAVAPGAGVHPIVRQMRGGSSVIEELRGPAPGCRTRFVSFWSELDQVMVPVETACVDHPDLDAVNVRVTGIGHLALPVHPTVAAAVREALEAPEAGEDDATAAGATSAA
ncbi:alpha/beta fold hydrolase [Streptomyces sp. CS7]|uniref:esterase/lipase family protein n=1 Tax=Streptomyces sp. CS-7 TaxID=2906769 RepID=UPI0021B42A0D|nr:alpha/beta fold hydrolase [Streptomyces sp. CS-7]MCT6778613.1 alpha/beta fold hydrolase [Streptomyces sp. CS-7]